MAEILEQFEIKTNHDVNLTFTPHLLPQNRGILSTIYVTLKDGQTLKTARQTLEQQYQDEFFVQILPEGLQPATRHVRGSNFCLINIFPDQQHQERLILISVIDNLVKGASGQAVQNFNLACGFEETIGLTQPAIFP